MYYLLYAYVLVCKNIFQGHTYMHNEYKNITLYTVNI